MKRAAGTSGSVRHASPAVLPCVVILRDSRMRRQGRRIRICVDDEVALLADVGQYAIHHLLR